VAAAQARGFATVQMQHGIWPYADLEREMTWLSDVVATWSDEFEEACRETVQWADGSKTPRAVVAGAAFETTGCPLFDRYAGGVDDSLELQLGEWVTHYSRRILVATNLHWTQHRAGAMVNPAILDLAAARPDTLFLLKPHLVHDVDDALLAACPPNVVVLDEFCCLFAGLDSARLISASDAVISTQSTVVLEAGLARVPVVTLDSGNPNRYRHVDLVDPTNLPSAIDETFHAAATEAFVDHYYDRTMLGRATANVLQLIAHRSRDVLRAAPSVRHTLALARFSEYLSVYAGDLVSVRAWADRNAALAAAERGRVERALAEEREGRLRDQAAMEARYAELEHVQTLRDLARLTPRHGRTVRVLLFGASEAGRRALDAARRVPHLEVLAFLDNDRARWASYVDGVPVWAPTPDCFGSADAIVITSIHTRAIADQVAAAGHADRIVYNSAAFDQLALRSRTA